MRIGDVLRLRTVRHHSTDGKSWSEFKIIDGKGKDEKNVFLALYFGVERQKLTTKSPRADINAWLRSHGWMYLVAPNEKRLDTLLKQAKKNKKLKTEKARLKWIAQELFIEDDDAD